MPKPLDAPVNGPKAAAPRAKVLLVEDSVPEQKAVAGMLKPLQLQIDTAENGEKALQMMREKPYDLILMDHMMPGMSGIDLTERLRQIEGECTQKAPVIAMTASESADVRDHFLKAGANDFLAKPVEAKVLRDKIRHWLPAGLQEEGGSPMEEAEPAILQLPEDAKDRLAIDGLDVVMGIRNCGTEELFISLLGDVYHLIDMKAAKVERCMENGLYRDVTVEVHSLKNTARLIGAGALSEGFSRLERYGAEEDFEALKREVPAVLEQFKALKPLLRPFGAAEAAEKKTAAKEELLSLLGTLKMAMERFDVDVADEALRRLDAFRLPGQCQLQMQALRAHMADVNIEEVIELSKTMMELLEKA